MRVFSFPPISDKNSKVLILGTMPGAMSLKLNQYYGHGGNSFWKIMFEIHGEPFSTSYEKRKQLLLVNNIALWDVLQACERQGSSDNMIASEVPNDFDYFFKTHPLVKRIAFNGQNAEEYFSKYVQSGSGFRSFTFPSTSPANTWKTFEEKLTEWKMIKSI